MAAKRSKSKPELEFQDGGPLFSETGSSNISIWYASAESQNADDGEEFVETLSRI